MFLYFGVMQSRNAAAKVLQIECQESFTIKGTSHNPREEQNCEFLIITPAIRKRLNVILKIVTQIKI